MQKEIGSKYYINARGGLERLPSEQRTIDELLLELREETSGNGLPDSQSTPEFIGALALAEKQAELPADRAPNPILPN